MARPSKAEKEKMKQELEDLEKNISSQINNLNPDELFMEPNELPALSEHSIEQLDYNKQLGEIRHESEQIINNLAELYLGNEALLTHPYIEAKRKKDADYYSRLEFLVSASEKTLMTVMREIESGNSNTRMFEVQSMLQREMRDNIKLSLRSLADIEKFYKTIREDLGVVNTPSIKPEEEEETTNLNMKEFNSQLEEMMKNGQLDFDVDDEFDN